WTRRPRDARGRPGRLRRTDPGRCQHGLAAGGRPRAPAGARAARCRADRAALCGTPARSASLAAGTLLVADRRGRECGHDRRSRRPRRGRRGGERQARQMWRDRSRPGDAEPRPRARVPDLPRLHGGDVDRDRRIGGRRLARRLGRPRRQSPPRRRSLLGSGPRRCLPLATRGDAGAGDRAPPGLTVRGAAFGGHRQALVDSAQNVRFMWTSWWTSSWTNPLLAGGPAAYDRCPSRTEGASGRVGASIDGSPRNVRADRIRRRVGRWPGVAMRWRGLEDRPSMDRTNVGERAFAATPAAEPEAIDFVRFCHRRRRVGWPELYDEMCAVAGRGLYRGYGAEELSSIGIGFGLFQMPALAGLVAQVVAEDVERRRRSAAALQASLAAQSADLATAPASEAAAGPTPT